MLRVNIGNNCLKSPPKMTLLPPNNKSLLIISSNVLSRISHAYRGAIGASSQVNTSVCLKNCPSFDCTAILDEEFDNKGTGKPSTL